VCAPESRRGKGGKPLWGEASGGVKGKKKEEWGAGKKKTRGVSGQREGTCGTDEFIRWRFRAG